MKADDATITPSPSDELARLRQEVELLRAERQQFIERIEETQRKNECLQHQLQQLLRRYYGRSAEKIDPKQMQLFQELLEQLAPEGTHDAAAHDDTVDTQGEPTSSPSPRRKGHGRRRLPADLPRKTIIHDLPEDQKSVVFQSK